jgi:hypothetical protein
MQVSPLRPQKARTSVEMTDLEEPPPVEMKRFGGAKFFEIGDNKGGS